MILKKYSKDPNSTIDFLFDFAGLRNGSGHEDYLEFGETISSAVAISSSVDLAVNQTGVINNDTSVQVWVSGGVLGLLYTLTVRITTSANRIDDRSISIFIENL